MDSRDRITVQLLLRRYDRLAQTVIYHVKRSPKEGRQSPEDSGLANLWEEYKAQVQEQESLFFDLYENLIHGLCHDVIAKLPSDERKLLWLYSDAFFDWDEDEQPHPPYSDDDVADELMRTVRGIAANEEIRRPASYERYRSEPDFYCAD